MSRKENTARAIEAITRILASCDWSEADADRGDAPMLHLAEARAMLEFMTRAYRQGAAQDARPLAQEVMAEVRRYFDLVNGSGR